MGIAVYKCMRIAKYNIQSNIICKNDCRNAFSLREDRASLEKKGFLFNK